jgi:hypothetical protein
MPEKNAIATLCLGEKYQLSFREYFYNGWKKYADRHGLEVIVLTEPLDFSSRAQRRSPAWQKCLINQVPMVSRFDRVAWIDCDISINPESPDVFKLVPAEKIGAVDDFSTPSKEDHKKMLQNLYSQWGKASIEFYRNLTPREYYSNYGLNCDHTGVVQTGMMVYTPTLHSKVFEKTYMEYEDPWGPKMNYEMRPLSHEILQNCEVEWLSPKFNMQWAYFKTIYYPFLENKKNFAVGPFNILDNQNKIVSECVKAAFDCNYFLHFAGGSVDYQLLSSNS